MYKLGFYEYRADCRFTKSSTSARRSVELIVDNPYIEFIASEMWAGLAGVAVYALFRLGAFAAQYITTMLPLSDKAPALFLETALSWGAATSAAYPVLNEIGNSQAIRYK